MRAMLAVLAVLAHSPDPAPGSGWRYAMPAAPRPKAQQQKQISMGRFGLQ